MDRRKILTRAALTLLVAAFVFTACEDDLLNPPDPVNSVFARYVAIGNSLTAGYQSGGINDSTQRQSYAALIADEMDTEFHIPLLSWPGCGDPLTNIFTQERLGDNVPGFTGCAYRSSPIQERINNVAVPGASVIDALSNLAPDSDPNTLTSIILGGRTQVEAAREIEPTFVSILIGNNDILGALLDEDNPGNPELVTPPGTFAARYGDMLDSLEADGTLEGGVLIGLQPMFVNATTMSVPYFSAGAAWMMFEVAYDAKLDSLITAATGGQITTLNTLDVDPATCATAFVPFPVGGAALGQANVLAGMVQDSLSQGVIWFPPPVVLACTDDVAITAAELQNIAIAHAGYNDAIEQEAEARGWVFFDPETLFLTTGAIAGQFRPFPAFDSQDPQHQWQPFGGALSLDGIHWSASFHATYADALLDAVFEEYAPDM